MTNQIYSKIQCFLAFEILCMQNIGLLVWSALKKLVDIFLTLVFTLNVACMAQVNKSDHNMHINGTLSALEVLNAGL